MLFGEYLPITGQQLNNDWLIDDHILDESQGIFLRSEIAEGRLVDLDDEEINKELRERIDTLELEDTFVEMMDDGQRQTVFLAPVPPPTPIISGEQEGSREESSTLEGEALFIRSDYDDWVLA